MAPSENINERNETSQDEILTSILKKLSSSADSSAALGASPLQSEMQPTPSQPNPFGDIMSSLLSNPEMLSKLPTILSSIKPIIDMLGGIGAAGATAQTSAQGNQNISQGIPAAVNVNQNNKNADSRTALLCAMKPYLSHDRQNAIDYIIKLGRLGDILKTL